jgi:hypothetical protein
MRIYAGSFGSRLAAVLPLALCLAGSAHAQLRESFDGAAPADDDTLDDRPSPTDSNDDAAAAPATAPAGEADIALAADQERPASAHWRGSEFVYDNEVGLNGLDRSNDLTWNPYWAMSWSFKPRYWFDDVWNVRARLDLSREITEADDRTYSGETWVHDLLLTADASSFYTIPVLDISLSADLALTIPTSKVSQARTLALGLGPGVRLSRSFDLGVAGSLILGYHVRFTSFLNRYTTAELETPLIPGCERSDAGCDEFLNTGERNVQWRVQHGLDVAWIPLDWLSLAVGFEHLVSWLYDIDKDDPRISLQPEDDIDRRYASMFYVEATFDPWPPIEIGLGYGTISPQLAPDSTYYNPFYNRYTTMYLDLRLEIEGLIDELSGSGEEGDETRGSVLARGL